MATESKTIEINGIVQGVGFRPFVYQLAKAHGIKGRVANTASGVRMHAEGAAGDIAAFCEAIRQKAPPLSHITHMAVQPAAFEFCRDFSIVSSRSGDRPFTLISPDMSICDDCRRELLDPADRRFGYAFINCTNCGPRYTIIDDIPYDRPKTSMRHFTMCPDCRQEYENPENRRFHAQPNACPACGPQISLCDAAGAGIPAGDVVGEAAALLKQGRVLAVKGLGGFHLAVDATNDAAVRLLRERKRREEKPLAVMSMDLEHIRGFAHVSSKEEALLTSPQRPIVLLAKKEPSPLASAVSPGNRLVGAMLPYTPLHVLLLQRGMTALVMTSGNRSEEPIAIDNTDALQRLGNIADFFVLHDRDIYLRSDDSVVKQTGTALRFYRRSRGYVPAPVFLKNSLQTILACGAELKNTVCLTRENCAFLSQHIGDLENLATYTFFKQTIAHLKRILAVAPCIVAHDMHPDYLSTRYALEQEQAEKVAVQHHHAHIVGCMAENHVSEPVIGLSCDGTGYGSDGRIWGGEALLARYDGFDRLAHLSYVAMPGGAAAIREPWRMAVSYLYRTYGRRLVDLDLPMMREVAAHKIRTMVEMIEKKVNTPETSSLGRLFDGVAALAGIRQQVAFEGQAAMELEMTAAPLEAEAYDTDLISGTVLEITPDPVIRGIVRDMAAGVPVARISAKFHATLIQMFSRLCLDLKKRTGIDRVALSGGVFQNSILLAGLTTSLEAEGFRVLTHEKVPPNDGGIALGQAVIADAVSRRSR